MAEQTFEPVRVGVVGVGTFGRLHAVTLTGLSETELVALVDRDRDKLDQVSKDSGDVPTWDDLNAALAESNAEAWVIATSTEHHVPMASRVLTAGCSVLVEKPLASTLTEAESLATTLEASAGELMVGHLVLFGSEFRQLLIETQQRGSLRFIDAVRHRPTALQTRFPGETPLELLAVHDLYQLQAMVDGREPTECRAYQQADLAVAELVWNDGLVAKLTASMLTPIGMAGDGYDRLEVFGDNWAARLNPNPRPIELWDDRARWPMELETGLSHSHSPTGMLAEELRCFCRVVRKLEQPPAGTSYNDAMQVQRWLDRLKTSAIQNRSI